MTIESSEEGSVVQVTYCVICDGSTSGGESSFLKGLGELQREQKVELSLETCDCEDAPRNMLWRIKYVSEQKEDTLTRRWEQRDRKRNKKNFMKRMNSFEQYEEEGNEKEKELSRKKKLYKKQEDELLDVFNQNT